MTSKHDESEKFMYRVSCTDSLVIGERSCGDGDKDGAIPSGVDYVLSTAPDEIFDKPEVAGDGRVGGAYVCLNLDSGLNSPSHGSEERNDKYDHAGSRAKLGTANYCISKGKLVLKLCSRLKVFKPPSLFSYRRLLPCLMEIPNDVSCIPKSDQCPKN